MDEHDARSRLHGCDTCERLRILFGDDGKVVIMCGDERIARTCVSCSRWISDE